MIDIHSHILPAVDDGAEDMDMALAMLRQAAAEGIEAVVLTPHILPDGDIDIDDLHCCRFAELQALVDQTKIKVQLYLGAEIRFRLNLELVAEWPTGTIGETRYVLFDLPFIPGPLPLGLEACLFKLRTQGYKPILAHPERHPYLIKDMNQLTRLRQQEVAFQVNSGSLLGHFGSHAQQGSRMLLDRGWVECIASDVHNLSTRSLTLRDGRDYILQEFGVAEATRLIRRESCASHSK